MDVHCFGTRTYSLLAGCYSDATKSYFTYTFTLYTVSSLYLLSCSVCTPFCLVGLLKNLRVLVCGSVIYSVFLGFSLSSGLSLALFSLLVEVENHDEDL